MRIIDNTLVLENAADIARLLSCFKYYNTRWVPPGSLPKPYILEQIDVELLQELDKAWLKQTEKECE